MKTIDFRQMRNAMKSYGTAAAVPRKYW